MRSQKGHCGLVKRLATIAAIAAVSAAGYVHGGYAFYVSPRGDDEADGSRQRPWKTIGRALRDAGPDTTISLCNGIYRESVLIKDRGGAEGRPLTLRSAEGERAVLDGDFSKDTGIIVEVPYVTICGLEIRNYRQNGIFLRGPRAHHILVEKNVIHHISSSPTGEGRGARGIWALAVSDCTIRQNTIYFVVGNSECFGVLFDLRSAKKTPISNTVIEKNLLYWLDKAGVRIVDNSHPDRCHVLAGPAHIRGNISVHNAYVGLEVNYVNTAVTEDGPLGQKEGAPVCVEDNFVGWCSTYGLNPKQSADGLVRHNTIYRTQLVGYLQSGHDSYRMRVEGNLLAENIVGSIVHTVGEDNRFLGNYYRQPTSWPDFFWDRTNGWGATYADMDDLRRNSALTGVEANGVLDNEAELFRAPEQGDFRLIPGCPAAGAGPDGEDFGARESVLCGVGASARWALANIPRIPEINGMRVVAFSSEDPDPCPVEPDGHYSSRSRSVDAAGTASGLAEHLVDGVLSTPWRPARGATTGWVVLDLPGDDPLRISAFMVNVNHTRYLDGLKCHPRELKLHVRSSPDEQWREAGRYTRYRREEGRIFPIQGSPWARQVKLQVLSNHGWPGVLEIAEFRLYKASEPIE